MPIDLSRVLGGTFQYAVSGACNLGRFLCLVFSDYGVCFSGF